jgi:vitamin B12/bleomycin/antimicrobial peptide transport system ATP-binding/permease protein
MELLTDQPKMTLLSIGHRPELEAFHTRKIELARRGKSAKLVRDVELVEPSKNIMRRWMRRVTGTAYRPAS